jgi:hypothetical protein
MTTLLRNSKGHKGPVILAVKTIGNSIVGAFASEPWSPHMGHFGTGECFLFHLLNDSEKFEIYYTTGKNDYFLFCDGSFIAGGVGNGNFGLWIDSELENGSSFKVDTFGNEPLANEGENFKIDSVELWGVMMN